jgi:hypothetical protein
MTKDEGPRTKDVNQKADVHSGFVIRAYFVIRASTFVIAALRRSLLASNPSTHIARGEQP